MSPEVHAAVIKVAWECTSQVMKSVPKPKDSDDTITIIAGVFKDSYEALLGVIQKKD